MGFTENVLNKIRGTPAFKPAAVDTFGNWAIEAGDTISVDNDGVVETMPIFSSDMNWNGSAITTIACTGNQKREIQDKQNRNDYAMSSGLSGYTDRKTKELADSFGVELGGVRSALDVYVKNTEDYKEANAKLVASIGEDVSGLNLKVTSVETDVGELQTASAELTTRVDGAEASLVQKAEKSTVTDLSGKVSTIETAQASLGARVDGAEASISLNAQNIDGVASSVATIQADVVNLKGRIDLSGNVSVSDGQLTVLGNLVAAKSFQIGTEDFYIYGNKYTPQQITSTSGTVLVLGDCVRGAYRGIGAKNTC